MRVATIVALMCCWASVAAAQAAHIDLEELNGPGLLPKGMADTQMEVERLIAERKYDDAWARGVRIVESAHRYYANREDRDLELLANIAIADPKINENGKARLGALQEVLLACEQRLNDAYAEEGTPNSKWDYSEYARLFVTAVAMTNLAIACEDGTSALGLCDVALRLANKARFDAKDQESRKQHFALKAFVRILVQRGRWKEAADILARHWTFLEKKTATLPNAVKGMALLHVAGILLEGNRLTEAAECYLEADSLLVKASQEAAGPEQETIREAWGSARNKDGSQAYDFWAGVKREVVAYEDTAVLRKTLQSLVDKLADGLNRRDMVTVAGCVLDMEKVKDRVNLYMTEATSVQWSDVSVLPVRQTDDTIHASFSISVTMKSGEKHSGGSGLVFVRDGKSWKIARF